MINFRYMLTGACPVLASAVFAVASASLSVLSELSVVTALVPELRFNSFTCRIDLALPNMPMLSGSALPRILMLKS